MRLTDLFEGARPVATVWRVRNGQVSRGQITNFIPDLKPLTKIEGIENEKDEE